MKIDPVTKGTNLLVTKHKYLILFYPLLWLAIWFSVSDIETLLEEQEREYTRVKAILERIRREGRDEDNII